MSQQKPPRRKKRRWVGNIFLDIVVLIVLTVALMPIICLVALIILIAVPASGGGGASVAPPAGATGTPSPSATHVAAPARLGSHFDVQDTSGDTYAVALTKIVDPAQVEDQLITPGHGKRFVGAVFTIKVITGYGPQQEDAYADAALVGSDGQTYLPDDIPIVGYTDFAVGEVYAAQGGGTTGAMAFRVPAGVKVSKVEWSTFTSFGVRSTVQWNVP